MMIAHNGTCTMHCNLLTDIRIARETGYGGIEIIGSKLYRYLDAGLSLESVISLLNGFPVVALGYIQDIERYAPDARSDLMEECERMCSMAEKLGCPMVQLLTGPIGPGIGEGVPESYQEIVALPHAELMKRTARNIADLADIGAKHNITFYLEPLSWTRLHTLQHGLDLIAEAGRENVKLLIDFWHHWTSGVTPDDIAKLDKNLIGCVHFCDSLEPTGGQITHDLRDVWTGAGRIPLKEWVDAVLATGFDGWWSCELFSEKDWESDPWETARNLRELLERLLV